MRYALLLLAASSSFANPAWKSHGKESHGARANSTLAFPSSGQWHMGIDITQGLSDYTTREAYATLIGQVFTDPIYTLAYRLASKQFLGYGRTFFIETRQAYNIGFVDSAIVDNFCVRLIKNNLFNSDVALGTYFVLSHCLQMTMRPTVGFEYHSLHLEGTLDRSNPNGTLPYRLQLWGPFAGIGFGVAPTKRWSLTSRFAFHFPQGRHYFVLDTYERLNIRRHGMSLNLDSTYQIKKNMAWTVAFEHRQLAAYGPIVTDTTYQSVAHIKQTSLTSGLRFSF